MLTSPWIPILTVAAVAVVLIAVCRWPAAARWVKLVAMTAGIGIFFLGPGHGWALAAVLVAIGMGLQLSDWGKFSARGRMGLSGGFALMALLPFAASIRSTLAEFDQRREQHPLVSIRERLAYEPRLEASPSERSETSEFSDLWNQAELFAAEDRESQYVTEIDRRTYSLGKLHSDAYRAFAASPGFGFRRMRRPNFSLIPRREVPPTPLPAEPESGTESQQTGRGAGELAHSDPMDEVAATGGGEPQDIAGVHEQARKSFLAPEAFGYVRDLDHVAGFERHAFRRPFELTLDGTGKQPRPRWLVTTLQLVSLLKHSPPRVYETDELPDMARLDDVTTRPVDEFESMALPRLVLEEIVTEISTNRIHMLGALRVTKACLVCHQGKEGTLLGAFRYVLSRDPAVAEPKPAL